MTHSGSDNLISRAEVEKRVGLRRSAVFERVRLGTFPVPLRLGQTTVRWLESEVTAWLAALPQSREDDAQSTGVTPTPSAVPTALTHQGAAQEQSADQRAARRGRGRATTPQFTRPASGATPLMVAAGVQALAKLMPPYIVLPTSMQEEIVGAIYAAMRAAAAGAGP